MHLLFSFVMSSQGMAHLLIHLHISKNINFSSASLLIVPVYTSQISFKYLTIFVCITVSHAKIHLSDFSHIYTPMDFHFTFFNLCYYISQICQQSVCINNLNNVSQRILHKIYYYHERTLCL